MLLIFKTSVLHIPISIPWRQPERSGPESLYGSDPIDPSSLAIEHPFRSHAEAPSPSNFLHFSLGQPSSSLESFLVAQSRGRSSFAKVLALRCPDHAIHKQP